MGYKIYDKNGNVIGEQESESEKNFREQHENIAIVWVLGIIIAIWTFIKTYWWILLILVVVGFVVYLIVKNSKPKRKR